MRRDVFQAIADPTRRQIIAMLSSAPRNLNAIADEFDISRPAISKHIRILTECGLVIIKPEGRERFCHARLAPLKEVSEWTSKYHAFWSQKLDALAAHIANDRRKRKK